MRQLKPTEEGPNNYGYYVSLWPGLCQKKNQSKDDSYCHLGTSHLHTPEHDELHYCNNIDSGERQFHLHFLDVDRLNREIESFLQSDFNWSHFGGGIIKLINQEHCSSLVYRLLIAGRVEKTHRKLDIFRRSIWSSVGTGLVISTDEILFFFIISWV